MMGWRWVLVVVAALLVVAVPAAADVWAAPGTSCEKFIALEKARGTKLMRREQRAAEAGIESPEDIIRNFVEWQGQTTHSLSLTPSGDAWAICVSFDVRAAP